VRIVECKKNKDQIVVPIFYHIDPTHVRNQTGSYARAFEGHEKRFVNDLSKLQTWRIALAEAANISGWDCLGTRIESELVDQVASDILQKLDAITSGGLERRIETYKQIAKQKLENSLRTGTVETLTELTIALDQLADIKLEKAMRSDDMSAWEDLMITCQRLLQALAEKYLRTGNDKDLEVLKASETQINYLQREQANRIEGFLGI